MASSEAWLLLFIHAEKVKSPEPDVFAPDMFT
jgi:hypothetical protein